MRFVRQTALSFFAGKPGSTAGTRFPVGARLARDSGDAVYQADRVIVLRGQARLQQLERGFLWERGLPAILAMRFVRQTALSFIVGKPHSHKNREREPQA
jgi:hypothetical protein